MTLLDFLKIHWLSMKTDLLSPVGRYLLGQRIYQIGEDSIINITKEENSLLSKFKDRDTLTKAFMNYKQCSIILKELKLI